MAGIDASTAKRLVEAVLVAPADVPREAEARVTRVDEDGMPWVAVAGSDEETPANGSVLSEASVGQLVRVSVQGGKLSVVGNASSPSVGGTYVQNAVDPVSKLAEAAMSEAQRAHDAADVAETEAERAHVAADAAQGSADEAAAAATQAQVDATAAGTAAASAQASANQAIGDAAAAKSAADAAQADATAAGQAAAAAQGSADAAQASATRANSAATDALTQLSTVQDVVGTVEWAAAHSGEDMASYISSHLALTDAGLWVTLDSSGYRLLVSATGVSVVDPQSHTVSTFGESVRLDSSRPQYIGGEDAFIAWYDSDDDGVPDSLWIGGTSVTVGSKTLSELLGEVSRASADATEALETALDGAHLVISSTNGNLFKNGTESTVLQAAVFPNGGDRLDTIGQVRARFGASAYIEWKWKHESGEWGTLVSSDPHISEGGMWLTVTPEDVASKTSFSASLVVP